MDGAERAPRSFRVWLMTAVVCGALPMVVGAVVLVVFLLSEATAYSFETWVEVGVAILIGGLVLFCVGLVTLGVYLLKGRRQGVTGKNLAQNTIMTLFLLMMNFPAALACMWVAGDSISHVRLHLVNESATVVEDLNITWPGGEKNIGDLGPLDRAEISFLVSVDGSVDFTARQGGKSCHGELIGYVTTNMGETDDVVFLGECGFRVVMR